MTIGEQLRIARKSKGLTQKQLAELTGISHVTIQQYETNKRQPLAKNVIAIKNVINSAICDKMNTIHSDASENIFLEDTIISEEKLNELQKNMLSLFNSLDLTGKSKLLEYAELLQLKYRKEE